jgi:hypothetical protein
MTILGIGNTEDKVGKFKGSQDHSIITGKNLFHIFGASAFTSLSYKQIIQTVHPIAL